MALTTEQIDAAYRVVWTTVPHRNRLSAFAHHIEAEVRKDDEALIRQMLEALENSSDLVFKNPRKADARDAAIAAARARLEKAP